MQNSCTLCPRSCRADRLTGRGYCGVGNSIKIARAAPHYWEEPCISGEKGTGAIFFSGCPLRCAFCQNWEISHSAEGMEVTPERLRGMMDELILRGVHSISLITAAHFTLQILKALNEPLPVPVVLNSGGYESVGTLKLLEGKVDIYLPDMKFSDSGLAKRLCGAGDYFEAAKAAIEEMYRQVGNYEFGGNGMLKRGVIIRHLVMPGYVENTLGVLDWIADTFEKGSVMLSLMSQYTPCGEIKSTPPFDRPVSREEYDRVLSYLDWLEIEDGYIQEFGSSGEQYIPEFDLR